MKVAYIHFSSPHLWKIAKHLQTSHGWEPTYWLADISIKKKVEEVFPGITFQDCIRCRRAIHTNELSTIVPKPIDRKLIEALAKDQIIAMKIFYRHDATGSMFSFNDLIEHYYEMIKYWTTVIEEKKIELFISWPAPHGTEYVLYMLAKHFGIPWLYVDAAYCVTKNTHLITSSLEDRAKLLAEKYQEAIASSIEGKPNPESMLQIEKILSPYSIAIPDYMSSPEFFGEKGKWLKKFIGMLREITLLFILGPFKTSGSHFKFRKGPFRDERTSGNNLQYFFFERRMRRLGSQFKKIYEKYVVPPDFSKKYVFFAAPYQPEAQTLPDANIYYHVPLILEMLSKAIPHDWIIYYKEHPSTFGAINSRDLFRSDEYYKTVDGIEKIKMIDHNIDTFHLVDNSQLVATPTGTVGWEAVVRGKPSITFGDTWYNPCEGVFNIKNFDELEAAISKIKAGFVPNYQNLLKFVEIVDKYCVKDLKYRNYSTRYQDISNIDQEMQKYGEMFYNAYQTYFCRNH